MIRILEELRDLGNTIVVVEHDPEVMRAADGEQIPQGVSRGAAPSQFSCGAWGE
jgi:excinuclease UvrABC ATPase subunit